MRLAETLHLRKAFDMTTDHDFLDWQGVKYRTILATDATGCAISITHSVSPAGSGPPRHIHHGEDETFYIRTGHCDFWLEGKVFHKGPGETMFVPRGQSHTFLVPDGAPCDHLTIMTPGGFEGFFADMAAGQFRIPEDMANVVAAAGRYGMSFTGPPLSAAEVQR